MKKIILSTVALLVSVSASADVIKCTFTEPFVSTTYSMAQSTLTYRENITGKVQIIKNVSFQIKSAGVFELVSKGGKVLQVLSLNNNGNDGMSDDVYPFEVQDNNSAMTANSNIGGCSSNYLKVKKVD